MVEKGHGRTVAGNTAAEAQARVAGETSTAITISVLGVQKRSKLPYSVDHFLPPPPNRFDDTRAKYTGQNCIVLLDTSLMLGR